MSRYVDVNIYFGKKKFRVTGVIIVATLLVLLTCIGVILFIPARGFEDIDMCREKLAGERYIIHAGGFVTDPEGRQLSYTNSLESLYNCYENGNRISEFDLMRTSDGRIVCAHDSDEEDEWAYGVGDCGNKSEPPTLDEFKAAKFDGTLTTMSFDDLADFMKDHGDFYIVTDVKDDNIGICEQIRLEYPWLVNNIIVQIYHSDEYDTIKELGFDYIIYTLYNAAEAELDPDELARFVSERELAGVTFWEDFPNVYPDSFDVLGAVGIPMFVHTINDRDKMKFYIDAGITGIYTDVTDKGEQYEL
ncbi:MAG: hypothetical protein K6E49_05545 [Lachnospiraceae bacterium]|nr:hypothetical protein [Lachnospiraceae bacterium]